MGRCGLILALILMQSVHVFCDAPEFHFKKEGDADTPYDYSVEFRNNLDGRRSHWVKFRCYGGFDGTNSHDLGKFKLESGNSKDISFFLNRGIASFQIMCRFLNEVNTFMPRENVVVFDTRWENFEQKCLTSKGGCRVQFRDLGNNQPAEMFVYAGNKRGLLGDIPDSHCDYAYLFFRWPIRLRCKGYEPDKYHHNMIGMYCSDCPFSLFGGRDV